MMEEHIFKRLIDLWVQKISQARKTKEEVFGQYARECEMFYDGPHDFLWDNAGDHRKGFYPTNVQHVPKPTFGTTVNKAAELVQLMGPIIFFRNPIAVVRPHEKPKMDLLNLGPGSEYIQQMLEADLSVRKSRDEIVSKLLGSVLNYCARENDLRSESRQAITEALVKGRGLLWMEMSTVPGSKMQVPGAFYDSVDNLQLDPDAKKMSEITWCSRYVSDPWWVVEDRFQLPRGSLKKFATKESFDQNSRAYMDSQQGKKSKRGYGSSSDLLDYYLVYSKLGIGDKLKSSGSPDTDAFDEWTNMFEPMLGNYLYLAVCPGCPWFLNLPPAVYKQPLDEEVMNLIQSRLEWPTPFWTDGAWPFEPLDLHPHMTEIWPISHLRPALGELKFIDYAASFLMDKVSTTSREFIAVLKSASEEIKKTIERGESMSIIELESSGNRSINEVVQFLQHPAMTDDLLKVTEFALELFDKRTGLNELMYGGGGSRQMRSAQEASVRAEMTRIRPDDFSEKAEHWAGRVFRRLSFMARWHMEGQDVEPILGRGHATLWEQNVMATDVDYLVRELDVTVEVGSARKPNLDRDLQNMNTAMQTLLPILQSFAAATGDVGVINQLLSDWARTQGLDPDRYLIPDPPTPEAPPPAGQVWAPEMGGMV